MMTKREFNKRFLAKLLEDLIVNCYRFSSEMIMIYFYFLVVRVYDYKWPGHLHRAWMKINKIYYNEDIYDQEKKKNMIYNKIKEKYLQLNGLSFTKKK